MPCYDPPPAWEGAKRKNAESAVKILCGLTQLAMANNLPISNQVLNWFIEHREIDLEIALDERMSGSETPQAIRDSIAKANARLLGNPNY